MKHFASTEALAHVLMLADEYASTLCCHSKRMALEAIRVVREQGKVTHDDRERTHSQ